MYIRIFKNKYNIIIRKNHNSNLLRHSVGTKTQFSATAPTGAINIIYKYVIISICY
jgi:hypothetical protein